MIKHNYRRSVGKPPKQKLKDELVTYVTHRTTAVANQNIFSKKLAVT